MSIHKYWHNNRYTESLHRLYQETNERLKKEVGPYIYRLSPWNINTISDRWFCLKLRFKWRYLKMRWNFLVYLHDILSGPCPFHSRVLHNLLTCFKVQT